MDECVRHDWLNRASQGGRRSMEMDGLCSFRVLDPLCFFFLTVPLLQLSPQAFSSPLVLPLLSVLLLQFMC